MKQIMAIMSHDDAEIVSRELSKVGYPSVRMDSRGGFLNTANMTLFVGVEDMKVREVMGIIQKYSHTREYDVPMPDENGKYLTPSKAKVSGAVVFVYDVDQFYKL